MNHLRALLSVILSYSQMLKLQLKAEDPMRADIEEIQAAGERAAGLTRQLLAFSSQQVLEPRDVDLNGTVMGLEKMLHRLIGEDIELITVANGNTPVIHADPGQIEQVIMNLVVNARDAMPRGGKLTIETTLVELDATYAAEHIDIIPGPHVMLCVSDTGTGMDKATQARIFEPFFTTESRDQGTGLGLSTVFGIVKQSGGHIFVVSEVGQGTKMNIYFPRSENPAVNAAAAPKDSGKLLESPTRCRSRAGARAWAQRRRSRSWWATGARRLPPRLARTAAQQGERITRGLARREIFRALVFRTSNVQWGHSHFIDHRIISWRLSERYGGGCVSSRVSRGGAWRTRAQFRRRGADRWLQAPSNFRERS